MSKSGPIKVLVVEDDNTVRELWRRALQTVDYEVVEATTVNAALAALDSGGPDILLLDWWLDGTTTAAVVLDQWIQSQGGPVMVISGGPLPVDELYLAGAWHVLTKPVELGVFLAIVHRYGRAVKLERVVERYEVELPRLRKAVIALAAVSLLNLANLPQVVEWLGLIGGVL